MFGHLPLHSLQLLLIPISPLRQRRLLSTPTTPPSSLNQLTMRLQCLPSCQTRRGDMSQHPNWTKLRTMYSLPRPLNNRDSPTRHFLRTRVTHQSLNSQAMRIWTMRCDCVWVLECVCLCTFVPNTYDFIVELIYQLEISWWMHEKVKFHEHEI